jgi:hypothetical protein
VTGVAGCVLFAYAFHPCCKHDRSGSAGREGLSVFLT